MNVTSIQNDEILRSAREYIDQCPKTDNSSQTSVKATTVKTKSSIAASSKASKTSSQRQRDLLIAKHKREEVERQNEAALRLAKQELELEQLQENRKRLAKAHLSSIGDCGYETSSEKRMNKKTTFVSLTLIRFAHSCFLLFILFSELVSYPQSPQLLSFRLILLM